jgi:hypothetical protein
MNAKKIILSAVIIWIIGTVFGWLTCGWLFNSVYRIEPIIWLSPEAMMDTTNMVLANVVGIFTSLIYVSVFAYLYKGIPGEGVKKGIHYGFIVWLVGALSGMITLPFFMTIAITVVIYWVLQALVLNLINGAIIGAIYKPKGEQVQNS